jgi:hypothetical protein
MARKRKNNKAAYGITGYVYDHDFSDGTFSFVDHEKGPRYVKQYVLYELNGAVYKVEFKWDWNYHISDGELKQQYNRQVGEETRFMSTAHDKNGQPASKHEQARFRVMQKAAIERNWDKKHAGFKAQA